MRSAIFILLLCFTSISSLKSQNVGIGEPNPSEKLDVNGRIVANGFKNKLLTVSGSNLVSIQGSNLRSALSRIQNAYN